MTRITAMSCRAAIAIRAAMTCLKKRLIDWSLGPAARAGQFVADPDSAIIGLYSRRPVQHSGHRRSLTNFEL